MQHWRIPLIASSRPGGVCGAVFNVQKVAAGLHEHCDCTKQTLCSISLCHANLCLFLHNSGCQMPEGPDYLLPVIILSLIDPLMQNVQNQFGFFPLVKPG